MRHGPGRKHFVGTYGGNEPDASLLLLPIAGCFRSTDPFILRTIEWLRRGLGADPFLRRYRMDDGVGGPEGDFIPCGFWLPEALALANRIEEAEDIFGQAGHPGGEAGAMAGFLRMPSKAA